MQSNIRSSGRGELIKRPRESAKNPSTYNRILCNQLRVLFQYVDNCPRWWLSFRQHCIRRVVSMKILRKIFKGKKKKHIVNKKKRTTSRARNTSRTRDAHLLKDDFLFGAGTRRSKPHRRKHKVCAKKSRGTEYRCQRLSQRISQRVCYDSIACKRHSSDLKTANCCDERGKCISSTTFLWIEAPI